MSVAEVRSPDGLRLHAEAHGSGVPVLLSCGYTTTCEIFRPLVGPLTEAGARVLLWDLRGHGRSEAPHDPEAYRFDRVLEDQAAVLEWGAPGRPAVLAGFSFGGLASLHFTLRHPERVRALALLASGPGFKKPEAQERWAAQTARTAEILETRGFEAFLAGRGGDTAVGRRRDTPAARAAAQAMLRQDPVAVGLFGRHVSGLAPGAIDRLSEVAVPTLVAVGEEDRAFGRAAEVMAARIPGAHARVIPGAGHVIPLEEPGALASLLAGWISELDAAPGRAGP